MSNATRWGFNFIPTDATRRWYVVVWRHPAEARKAHPPVKPNRRRVHRRH